MTYDQYMDAHKVAQRDPYVGSNKIITTLDGKTIKAQHGASDNDPGVKKVNGNDVDYVMACNAKGNGAGKKKSWKGKRSNTN